MIHLIKNDPAYESKKKILLVSCNTGNKSKAPRSYTVFAQKLADYLGEGSVVIAPNAYARVWNTGELGVDHDGKTFKGRRM